MRARCSSCMNPWQFDVIVTTNLFGDILSDQLAGLVGRAGHGARGQYRHRTPRSSRPCTARRRTSPARVSPIRSRCCSRSALMLEHIDRLELANRLRTAIDQVLRTMGSGRRILGGKASTSDFTQSIIRRIQQ